MVRCYCKLGCIFLLSFWSWDSVVNIVTSFWSLDNPGFESQWREEIYLFSETSRLAKVNEWNCTSTHFICHHGFYSYNFSLPLPLSSTSFSVHCLPVMPFGVNSKISLTHHLISWKSWQSNTWGESPMTWNFGDWLLTGWFCGFSLGCLDIILLAQTVCPSTILQVFISWYCPTLWCHHKQVAGHTTCFM